MSPLVITAWDTDDARVGDLLAARTPSPPSPRSSASAAEALVRRFEGAEGRQLVDTRQGGWVDMPSEAALKALARWRLGVRASTLPVPRYLSVREGEPQRFIDIHVMSEHRPDLRLRQTQLLRAAELGAHGWLYAVIGGVTGEHSSFGGLLLLQDPARAMWTAPAAPTAADSTGGDPAWRLPRHELVRHAVRVPLAG